MKNIISIFSNTAISGALILLGLVYFGMGLFYGMQVVLMAVVPALTFVFIFEVLNYIKDNSKKAEEFKSEELCLDAIQRITKEYEEKRKEHSTNVAKVAQKSARKSASKAKSAANAAEGNPQKRASNPQSKA